MNKNKKIYVQLNELREKLLDLKQQEKDIKKEYDDVSNNCSHDYILIYDKGKQRIGSIVTKCCCLVCGKKIAINDDLENINMNDICFIDITDKIRELNIVNYLFDELDEINDRKIEKAKKIFSKYFSKEYENYDEKTLRYMIKKDILESFAIKKEIKIKIK